MASGHVLRMFFRYFLYIFIIKATDIHKQLLLLGKEKRNPNIIQK